MDIQTDRDPGETQEWRDALESVLLFEGPERARFLLEELITEARRQGAPVPYSANTPYLNTIPPSQEEPNPGDPEIEPRIRSLVRWNAVAIVLRANKELSELGGHIASFQSAATQVPRILVIERRRWHAQLLQGAACRQIGRMIFHKPQFERLFGQPPSPRLPGAASSPRRWSLHARYRRAAGACA